MNLDSDWTKKLWTFDHLRQFAAVRGDLALSVDFLKSIQVVPYEVVHIPAPDYVNTNLDPDKIPAGYLAALAYEWDSDGPSTPLEFVDSLRPELRNSPERDVVRDALSEAGKAVA